MPVLSSLSRLLTPLILGFTLLGGAGLAGCDRQSAPPSQAVDDAGSAKAAPAPGQPDRSHAGSAMPDFTFSDPAGQQIRLAQLAGGPVLLNLWATWCAPCITEMPLLDNLAGKYAGSLRVVTVSQDIKGGEVVAPFFAEKGFTHLQPWLDPDSELAFHFGGANLPLTIAYDAQGREVWRIAGDYDWSGDQARTLIGEMAPELAKTATG